MKYSSVHELRQAYARGEITTPLMIDNDSISGFDDSGTFEMHPSQFLEELLDDLLIPWEHV